MLRIIHKTIKKGSGTESTRARICRSVRQNGRSGVNGAHVTLPVDIRTGIAEGGVWETHVKVCTARFIILTKRKLSVKYIPHLYASNII